jgi:cytochrome P450
VESQVKRILQNPELLDDAPHRVIYNELLDPETNKGFPPLTASQLRDEAQTLFGAGAHTTGTTLMTGTFHLLRNPEAKQRLVDELHTAWPVLDQAPSYEQLEKLPFLVSALIYRI